MKRDNIPLKEKYALTVTEASQYYNIGPRRLRLIKEKAWSYLDEPLKDVLRRWKEFMSAYR